jgi:hypothetical protein
MQVRRLVRQLGVFGRRCSELHRFPLLPPSASRKAAGKSPSIQPGQRAEDDGKHPGTDQRSHGSHAETNSQETATAMPAATAPVVEFPLCHAAVGNIERHEWALADAILAECSEPGANGVRTGSYSKIRPPDLIDFSMTPNRRLSAVRCQETEFRWC